MYEYGLIWATRSSNVVVNTKEHSVGRRGGQSDQPGTRLVNRYRIINELDLNDVSVGRASKQQNACTRW